MRGEKGSPLPGVDRKKRVVFLVGPTAVGKSRIACSLAGELSTEIISADSRQVYRGMDIGTGKPTRAERAEVPHHIIDCVDPHERFNVGLYRQMAREAIIRLHDRDKIPLVVGGTGLYVKVLAYGLFTGPGADWGLRSRLLSEEEARGRGYLHSQLAIYDPESARKIHPHDCVKIIRALEVYSLSGSPLSSFHHSHRFGENPYQSVIIGLRRERGDLFRRIEERVEEMMARGLVEETERLLQKGYDESLPALRGLGYRQVIGYLKGRYPLSEAIRLLKRETKRYAKRQMTWFRADPHIVWVDILPGEKIEETCAKIKEIAFI